MNKQTSILDSNAYYNKHSYIAATDKPELLAVELLTKRGRSEG
jgi:hypothetical protein